MASDYAVPSATSTVAALQSSAMIAAPPHSNLSLVERLALETRDRKLAEEAAAPPPPAEEFALPDEALHARAEEIALLCSVLPPELIKPEHSLAQCRSLDYGFLSPLECTEQFVSDYKTAFMAQFGMSCWVTADTGSSHFADVWQLRQCADRTGLPYPIFCEIVMHLYKAPKFLERLRLGTIKLDKRVHSKTWRKRLEKLWGEREAGLRARTMHLPQYHVEHFRNLPAQLSHRRAIIKYAKRTRAWENVAAAAALQRRTIPLAELLNELTDREERSEVISSLKAHAADYAHFRSPVEPIEVAQLMQSCFGWFRASAENCVACPLRSQCANLATSSGVHRP